MPCRKEQPMRAHSLGRWVGHLVAVAALGAGTTLGAVAAGVAIDTGPHASGVADVANAESSSSDATTDGFEWN
jgi:hypothetical protein